MLDILDAFMSAAVSLAAGGCTLFFLARIVLWPITSLPAKEAEGDADSV